MHRSPLPPVRPSHAPRRMPQQFGKPHTSTSTDGRRYPTGCRGCLVRSTPVWRSHAATVGVAFRARPSAGSSFLERLQAMLVLGTGVVADTRTLLAHVFQAALKAVGRRVVQAHEVNAVVDTEPDQVPLRVQVAGHAELVVAVVLIAGRPEVAKRPPDDVVGIADDLPRIAAEPGDA